MAKPSIILIPGSFALPEFYKETIDAVRAKGYEVTAIHNLSSGLSAQQPRPGLPSMYDDAAQIAGEIEKLADQGKDVVLIPHSYGGVPTSQSTKGLTKAEREKAGKKGGVVEIGYMTCIVPPLGKNAMDPMLVLPPENQLDLTPDETGWMLHKNYEAAAAIVFSDLSKDEGVEWMKKFPQHSSLSFANELTHAGYKDVPTSWLFCENDRCLTPQVQQSGIDAIEKESAKKVDVTRIEADHCPMANKPELVADWIIKIANKH